MATLEERVQRLEEIAAIKRLKRLYARTVDRFAPGEEFAALFTEDGVLDSDPLGYYEGRAAIAEFFNGARKTFSFFLHYTDAPIIDIAPSGTEATGTWYMWEPATRNGEAVWMGVTCNDRYKKVNGEWKFTYFGAKNHFVTPYDQGWVKQPFLTDLPAAPAAGR